MKLFCILNFALVGSLCFHCGKDKGSENSPPTQDPKGKTAESTPDPAPSPSPKPDDSGPLGSISENKHYRAAFKWQTGPHVGKESTGILTLQDSEGNLAGSVSDLKVTPWMKIHGHGTGNVRPNWSENSHAKYLVKNVHFIMSGPWELNVEARVNGSFDKVELKVEVP